MKSIMYMLLIAFIGISLVACEETDEGVDNQNDIIIRNLSESYVWIMIDGSQRGSVENNGIGKTMWDNIADGVHVLTAYTDENYTEFHCTVVTDELKGDDDFAWYLMEDDEYEGTKEGDC